MKTNNFLKLLVRDVNHNAGAIDLIGDDGNTVSCKMYYEPSYTGYVAFFSPGYPYDSSNCGFFKGTLARIGNGTTSFSTGGNQDTYQPKMGIILGDGNTPPDPTDYWLSGNMITDFTASVAMTCTIENNKVVVVGVYTINNTSSSAFTIREIGFARSAVDNSSASKAILLMRDVLDTPITVAGNGQATFEYRLTAG